MIKRVVLLLGVFGMMHAGNGKKTGEVVFCGHGIHVSSVHKKDLALENDIENPQAAQSSFEGRLSGLSQKERECLFLPEEELYPLVALSLARDGVGAFDKNLSDFCERLKVLNSKPSGEKAQAFSLALDIVELRQSDLKERQDRNQFGYAAGGCGCGMITMGILALGGYVISNFSLVVQILNQTLEE